MTVHVKGRTKYRSDAVTRVEVLDTEWSENTLLVIDGGYLEVKDNGDFVVSAKHQSAVDCDGDSVYVAHLKGAGLRVLGMTHSAVEMSGVVLEARYYTGDPGDGELRFIPPYGDMPAGKYVLRVTFISDAGGSS